MKPDADWVLCLQKNGYRAHIYPQHGLIIIIPWLHVQQISKV